MFGGLMANYAQVVSRLRCAASAVSTASTAPRNARPHAVIPGIGSGAGAEGAVGVAVGIETAVAVGVGAEGAPVTAQVDVDGAAGMPVGAVNEGMVRSTRSAPSTRETVDGWAAACFPAT